MAEEITYATVVFKNSDPPPEEKKDDPTNSSDDKPKEPASTEPQKKEEPTVHSDIKPKAPVTTEPDVKAAAAAAAAAPWCTTFVLGVCLLFACLLLLACIIAIIPLSVILIKKIAAVDTIFEANEELYHSLFFSKRNITKLNKVIDQFNSTLGAILQFDSFPVNKYCPEGTIAACQPCQTGWDMFGGNCYLFYDEEPPWKSWGDSQKYCKQQHADLVVIDSLQEQEFISNHTTSYFDEFHGYWLGLFKNNDGDWVWVDGNNDTLMYWITENNGMQDQNARYGLMIPERTPTASWERAEFLYQNRFICENEALIWPD